MKAEDKEFEAREAKAKSLGARYAIVIEENNKILFVKEPDKVLYDAFFEIYDANPRAAKESALKTLVIKEVSDMDIFDDYKALLSAFSQLADIMAVKKSSLKRL